MSVLNPSGYAPPAAVIPAPVRRAL